MFDNPDPNSPPNDCNRICKEASDMATMLSQHVYDPTLVMTLPGRYGQWENLSEMKAFNEAVNHDLRDIGIPYEQLHVDLGLNNNSCRPGQYVTMWATLHRDGLNDSSTAVGRPYIDLPYCY